MVGEGCCDCLVDSGQGHAGHAAVNIAQHAPSSFEDGARLLALDLQHCLGWRAPPGLACYTYTLLLVPCIFLCHVHNGNCLTAPVLLSASFTDSVVSCILYLVPLVYRN